MSEMFFEDWKIVVGKKEVAVSKQISQRHCVVVFKKPLYCVDIEVCHKKPFYAFAVLSLLLLNVLLLAYSICKISNTK